MLAEADDFTMVIVTQGERLDALETVVRHMCGCEQLIAILLVWNKVGGYMLMCTQSSRYICVHNVHLAPGPPTTCRPTCPSSNHGAPRVCTRLHEFGRLVHRVLSILKPLPPKLELN